MFTKILNHHCLNSKRLWLTVPLFFLVVYFCLFLRADRFEDENIALNDGTKFIHSVFSQDVGQKKIAAHINSIDSIGLLVTLPTGLAMDVFNNIAAPRVVMGAWAFLYWCSLCFLFLNLCPRLSALEKTFFCFILVCLIQGIPSSYTFQAVVLGEFPGAAFLFLALASLILKRPRTAVILASTAVTVKFNYVLYLPPLVLWAWICVEKNNRWRWAGELFLLSFVPLLLVQILKCVVYGPSIYLKSWETYFEWMKSNLASSDMLNRPMPVNEFPTYSRRWKAYYILGTFLPLVSVGALYIKKVFDKKTLFGFFLMGCVILVASAQWYFMADLKFWRRTISFIVPGYSIGVMTLLIFIRFQIGNILWRRVALSLVFLLALYVQFNHSIWGVLTNSKPLTHEEQIGLPNMD